MRKGLSRDEDTALRCLAALAEAGRMSPEQAELLATLRKRDRRATIRLKGTKVPRQKDAA